MQAIYVKSDQAVLSGLHMNRKRLTIELNEQALDNLQAYCRQSGQDQTTVIQTYLLKLGNPQAISAKDNDMPEHHPADSNTIIQLQQAIKNLERERADLEMILENTLEHSDLIMEQLRIAKAAAEAASQSKSTFLARMSHELRTPLNAILGFSQLLENAQSLKPQQREQLTIINRSGEHLLNLVNDILEISKLEASKISLNQEIIDLPSLLYDIQAMFRLKADAKDLQLILNQSSELPQYVSIDVGKLRQVLINLLDNAVKFTDSGQVYLTVRSEVKRQENVTSKTACTLYFEVKDSGPGITETELETIFVPFEQTEIGRNTHQGAGLGLSISQKFVQLMGGNITVRSQIGVGSTFEFHIPVYQYSSLDVPVESKEETLNEIEVSSQLRTKSLGEMLRDMMPTQWVSELHYAASQLKGKQVLQLLEQIPAEQTALMQCMKELAEHYQFDEIVKATTL